MCDCCNGQVFQAHVWRRHICRECGHQKSCHQKLPEEEELQLADEPKFAFGGFEKEVRKQTKEEVFDEVVRKENKDEIVDEIVRKDNKTAASPSPTSTSVSSAPTSSDTSSASTTSSLSTSSPSPPVSPTPASAQVSAQQAGMALKQKGEKFTKEGPAKPGSKIQKDSTPPPEPKKEENQISDAQRQQKQRSDVVNELINTERDYVRDMEFFVLNCVQESVKQKVLNKTKAEVIFSNVETIYSLHVVFLMNLEKEINGQSHNVAKPFQQMAAFFKLYSEYCSSYPKAMEMIKKLRKKNSSFKTFLQEFKSKSGSKNLT
eukprot:TRINITY_DN5204_c0_g1_i1.p1 TRINITY_DN5204_c0_g1~~TRINITY_DN5204_c0_g1_i1.p1  ORF type:complete len:318 (-),score=79.95 TRINITY_DN5204_c0_g1_i1:161-1114(-)